MDRQDSREYGRPSGMAVLDAYRGPLPYTNSYQIAYYAPKGSGRFRAKVAGIQIFIRITKRFRIFRCAEE